MYNPLERLTIHKSLIIDLDTSTKTKTETEPEHVETKIEYYE